jgi:hypothetical protein
VLHRFLLLLGNTLAAVADYRQISMLYPLLLMQNLGAGGDGKVFLAMDTASNREVAIKRIHLGYDWSCPDAPDVQMQTQGAFVAVRELLDNYSAWLFDNTSHIIPVRGVFLSWEADGRTVDRIEHQSVATHVKERLHWDEDKIKEVTVTSIYLNMVMEFFGRDLTKAVDDVLQETKVRVDRGRCGMVVPWRVHVLGGGSLFLFCLLFLVYIA